MSVMRTGKASIEKYTARQRGTGRTYTAYRVRWRVYDDTTGQSVARKKGDFLTKGAAEAFIENLTNANLRRDGWSLDRRGHPAPPAAPEATGAATIQVLEEFVAQHWGTQWRSARSKEKNRGRLLVVAATLLQDPLEADAVLRSLDASRGGRGERPSPSSPAEHAGRYLRDHALDPGQHDRELGPTATAARDWLLGRSLPVDQIDDVQLQRVRSVLLTGRRSSTATTYWATVKTFLTWLVTSGRISANPSAGMPRIQRDLAAEAVDPERVPDTDELWRLAHTAEDRYGLAVSALIVALFFAALRIGEAAGLQRRDIEFTSSDQAWITVRSQSDRVTARYSADGSTTHEGPPKGRTSGPQARRRIPIPRQAASVLRRHLDSNVGSDASARLFTQPRGGVLNSDAFRRDRWHPLVEQVFEPDHPLAAITPHDLRHGGMTRWLRRGVPFKKIQRFGGWASLKVMLDVYAGVLPDDDDVAMRVIEDHDGGAATAAA